MQGIGKNCSGFRSLRKFMWEVDRQVKVEIGSFSAAFGGMTV